MKENLKEAIEFLKDGLETLKKLGKRNQIFYRGRGTAESIAISGSRSHITKRACIVIAIIRNTLTAYGLTKGNEEWMIQEKEKYIMPIQLDMFVEMAEKLISAEE